MYHCNIKPGSSLILFYKDKVVHRNFAIDKIVGYLESQQAVRIDTVLSLE